MVVNERLETVPPPKFTNRLAGSNPLPVIVNVNACPAVADVGVIPLIWGAVVVEITVNVIPLEGTPLGPFCTVAAKAPVEARLAGPIN